MSGLAFVTAWMQRAGAVALAMMAAWTASAQSGGNAPQFPAAVGNQIVSAGTPANFSAEAIGAAPLSYQWQRFPQGGTSWTVLTSGTGSLYLGATTPSLTVQATTLVMSGDQFRCVVTNPFGTATSSTGLLTVEAPRIAPVIVTQPSGQTVNVGQSTTLTVVANGSPAPTFQWYRGSTPIVGATGSSFRLSSAQLSDAGNYFVEVSNNWGTVVSQIVPIEVVTATSAVDSFTFSLLAGQIGTAGVVNGTGNAALFRNPNGLAVDSAGNLYVADESNHLIRKVTPAGVVTTFAGLALSGGSDDGTGTQARFLYPRGVAVDAAGVIYVADTFNHTIRRITPAGVVTTLAGRAGALGAAEGKGPAASFNYPVALAVDPSGNVFVADRSNHTIRKVTPDGTVSTLAGTAGLAGAADGVGAAARFDSPAGIATDSTGAVYVSDSYNHTVRRISPTGIVSTLAGLAGVGGSNDGSGRNARFLYPNGLASDRYNNIYVAEGTNSTIRRILPSGQVSTVGGLAGYRGYADGSGPDARFHTPVALALDAAGNLYLSDNLHFVIRKGAYVSAAQIRTQPLNLTTMATVPVVFELTASGTGQLSYQWQRLAAGTEFWVNVINGGVYSGARTASLSIPAPVVAMSGDQFRCVVTNTLGSATSDTASLLVTPLVVAPTVVLAPESKSVSVGDVVSFAVTAAGTGPLSYRWSARSGSGPWVDLAADTSGRYTGATSSILVVSQTTVSMSGDQFTCTISNSRGTVTTDAATLTVTQPASKLSNVSVRATAGSGAQALIVGVAVGGGNKSLLVRATGPTLGLFGVPGFLPDPRLSLYNTSGGLLAFNDDWAGSPVIGIAMSQVGAFALAPDSKDAALLTFVEPGGYTLHAGSATEATGTALIEVYDLDGAASASRLSNLSARTQIASAGESLIVGFVVKGNAPRALLIRGVGPTLNTLGLSGTLADPKIEIIAESGAKLGENDNWGDSAALIRTFNQVGAFPFTGSSKDAALQVALPPGAYTVIVSGVGDATGTVLAEIYEIP